jgi:hypothetical protein
MLQGWCTMCNSKKACTRRYQYRLANFQLFSKWCKSVGIPNVSVEQFMTNKTKKFAHNAGKAKTPEKPNTNNNDDDNNNDDNSYINNNNYNENEDTNYENNNSKNNKLKGKSAAQESAGTTTSTTTTTTTPTKAINKEKNQTNNKKDTPKDNNKEKTQTKSSTPKLSDKQSQTTEAPDFSSMIKGRGWTSIWGRKWGGTEIGEKCTNTG